MFRHMFVEKADLLYYTRRDVIDSEGDYRCRWGELMSIKKPEGISNDLAVTGEWAMVVRKQCKTV